LALRRIGLVRRRGETPREYVERVRAVRHSVSRDVDVEALEDLAGLVELACYTAGHCTDEQVESAHRLAASIVGAHREKVPAPA
jgi:hypothetical protein